MKLSDFQKILHAADCKAAKAGPWILLVLALTYYASYFNNGLNLGGEGGTTAVLAVRLMEGQRPIVDTFLGYNVLWFYPIVWLFQLTGPDYFVLRGFFFFLCALTALIGFFTVRKGTGSGLMGLMTGIILVLIPGMLFRNYMGLLGVANQWALVSAFLLPAGSSKMRLILFGVSGVVLGLTYLIRVEVGLLMTVIWVGLLVLMVFKPGRAWRVGFKDSLVAGGLGLAAIALVHLPFAMDAHQRGYASSFYNQYTSFIGLFRWELQQLVLPAAPVLPSAVNSIAVNEQSAIGSPPPVSETQARRQRPTWTDAFTAPKSRDRFFAAAIYYPLLISMAMVASGSFFYFLALFKRNESMWQESLTVLVLTGCALTLFPQYFLFRPDTPHLVEFMIPLVPAMGCAVAMVWRHATTRLRLGFAVVASIISITQIVIHFGHAFPKESAGTIAARKNGPAEFVGLNNVRVKMKPERSAGLAGMQKVLIENSKPGEWIVCLPYSPTINFMTDRPSYLWDLYTDNTMAGPEFDAARIAEVEKFQPAAIVIDHRAINNSEESRFPNWAPEFYAYLQKTHDHGGEFLGNEIFLRRKAP